MIVGESGRNPVCKHHRIQIVWRIIGLTLDGTAEPFLRDLNIFSGTSGNGEHIIFFRGSVDHEQDWQP